MDELFITDSKIDQARKLHFASVRALQSVNFMGQTLLSNEAPNFPQPNSRLSAIPQIRPFDRNEQRQSLIFSSDIQHERVYTRPAIPKGQVPPITYSRTLYRKSDYSAYNKKIPLMPTTWPAEKVVSQSGLFITPPQSPVEPPRAPSPVRAPTPMSEAETPSGSEDNTPIRHNFSRKYTKRKMKQSPGHRPAIQRTKTFKSEIADISSGSSTPVSALNEAERASFNTLATSLKRSLSPASPVNESHR